MERTFLVTDSKTKESTLMKDLTCKWLFGTATWKRIVQKLDEGERVVKSNDYLVSDYATILATASEADITED